MLHYYSQASIPQFFSRSDSCPKKCYQVVFEVYVTLKIRKSDVFLFTLSGYRYSTVVLFPVFSCDGIFSVIFLSPNQSTQYTCVITYHVCISIYKCPCIECT